MASLSPECRAQGSGLASNFKGVDIPFGFYNSLEMVDMGSLQPGKEVQVKQSSQSHTATTCKGLNSTLK